MDAEGRQCAAARDEDATAEMLTRLLEMMSSLAAREADPEAVGEQRAHLDASAFALLSSFERLLPGVTPAMLQYRHTCEAYFGLLALLLENHPRHALTLSPALSGTVLSSLCFGVAHHELCVSQRALETVYELSRRAVRSHLVEVAIHLLQPLLTQLLLLLLHARLHGELLDPSAGNALLSLVVATPAHWGALSQQLVALQPSAEQQQATAQALGALTSANGVVCAPPYQALLRPNRARFRANLPALLLFARTSRMVLPPCEGS